jgi:hypothetical protein
MLIARPIIKKIFEDEPAIYNLIKKQRMIIMGFAFKSINSKNVNFNFSHKQEIRFLKVIIKIMPNNKFP